MVVNHDTILAAASRLRDEVRITPLLEISHITQPLPQPCNLFLKLELLQLTGSFKVRGVTNKLLATPVGKRGNGLVTASGGNHGRAVAYVGWKHGLPTTVYLPETAPPEKVALIKQWHARTIVAGKDLDEANVIAARAAEEANCLFIHPYADAEVINGQGTLGVDLHKQIAGLDIVIAAIGGGGLISGLGTYMKAINPGIRIIGVEPVGCPTLYESFARGHIVPVEHIRTKVGTLAIRRTSQLNFDLARACVDEIILVEDVEMLAASRWLWKEYGIAAEMSGAASLSGLLSGKIQVRPQDKVCSLICGSGKDGLL